MQVRCFPPTDTDRRLICTRWRAWGGWVWRSRGRRPGWRSCPRRRGRAPRCTSRSRCPGGSPSASPPCRCSSRPTSSRTGLPWAWWSRGRGRTARWSPAWARRGRSRRPRYWGTNWECSSGMPEQEAHVQRYDRVVGPTLLWYCMSWMITRRSWA